jgi:apolipoprotein N-acyltransferase
MSYKTDILAFMRSQWRLLAAVFSGVLLVLAFPPFEVEELAWVALVPLLLALRGCRQPFRIGYLFGVVYWFITLNWLGRVTIPGWILLALYCALYQGLFAMLYSAMLKCCSRKSWSNIIKMFAAALGWSGLEWLRAHLLTGFSWNQIAVSQFSNTVMIQIADWGGVYAVSTLIVLMNLALALTISQYMQGQSALRRRAHVELGVALICVALAFAYGVRRITSLGEEGRRELSVALLQPNVPQSEKWDAAHIEMIRERLAKLTRSAVPVADLIVWPETSTPGFLRDSPEIFAMLQRYGDENSQFLIGSMDYEIAEERRYNYFNSSFLIDADGRLEAKYDKRHLVLFGEYVPFQDALPFLKALTPIEGSFRSGTESTIFRVGEARIPVAALICFEDSFPYLASEAVRNGARVLVNQTNDAWFDPSCGSRQHLSQSVFRAVENRVPLIRAANTGISAHIDRAGRIRKMLTDNRGEVRTMGFLSFRMAVPPDNMDLSFHTYSDRVFGKGCAVVALALLGLAIGLQAAERRRAPFP